MTKKTADRIILSIWAMLIAAGLVFSMHTSSEGVSRVSGTISSATGNQPDVAAVLRCTGGSWGVIDDAGHAPVGVASVETLRDRVRVHYAAPLQILSANSDMDEQYVRYGVNVGSSVGTSYTDLFFVKDTGATPRPYLNPASICYAYSNVWFGVWAK